MQIKMNMLGYYGFTLVLLLSPCHQAKTAGFPQATDCSEIKTLSPEACSGVYEIQPAGVKASFQVYCEMRPDGVWTVFQRRTGEPLTFYKTWQEYKSGFGFVTNDHWLGLEKVFLLTNETYKNWVLRVELWDHEGGTACAEYKDFRLGSEIMSYKLHVGEYSGDAGDAIRGVYPDVDQNGFGFSTFDRDNDACSPCIYGDIAHGNCASLELGGWWYSKCGSANLNGDWHPSGDHTYWYSGLHWPTWKLNYSLKATRMMFKSV